MHEHTTLPTGWAIDRSSLPFSLVKKMTWDSVVYNVILCFNYTEARGWSENRYMEIYGDVIFCNDTMNDPIDLGSHFVATEKSYGEDLNSVCTKADSILAHLEKCDVCELFCINPFRKENDQTFCTKNCFNRWEAAMEDEDE